MTTRETRREDERRERSRGVGGLLRKGAPVVAGFGAGLLLGWWRGRDDGGATAGETGTLREAASRIRSRAIPAGLDPLEVVGIDRAKVAGTDRSTFVNPTVRVATGSEAQPQHEGETESRTAGTQSQSGATRPAGVDAEPSQLSPPTTRGMPMLGVGTARHADYDECVESVRQALGVGYRHVDAIERREAYYVEEAVGDAIDDAALDREDLFVATKVSPEDLEYDHVLTSAEESLDRLGLDAVDLLYVHWPTDEYDPTDTLDAFAELRREGLIEEIGVSNFTVDLLEEAIDTCEEPIFANQVEMHPLLPQKDLREFCAQDDVDVELVAYSPIARTDVEDVTQLQEVADKHGATPEQVSLAWLREKGVTAIPEATTEAHLRENWLSLGLELDDEDVEKIDSIEQRKRIVNPDDAPWNR